MFLNRKTVEPNPSLLLPLSVLIGTERSAEDKGKINATIFSIQPALI